MTVSLDRIDREILNLLQQDCRLTQQEIAERIGSSSTSVWRRIQNLEEKGVIRARVALLDYKAVGLSVCVICNVKLTHHSDDTRVAFEALVAELPEVTQCYAVSGAHDYALTVVVESVEAYERFLTRHMLDSHLVDTASSSFTLRTVKYSTEVTL